MCYLCCVLEHYYGDGDDVCCVLVVVCGVVVVPVGFCSPQMHVPDHGMFYFLPSVSSS